ncbi:4-diphosphocytidyl-2-C-methyl-D-erythritolkinase [Clostridium bornimense]|uniref:4-diphosphocytidyl-2-C-methyl-D-erythritol kinase n=1 Tax=Clostridium bornimense TaxID=1216932 RepID=W6SIH6_9CLOT|nr:4-(cytidine 5'-diphospho)-2-C-methyl-D-erythritol kinase [Clostridium bornimense]CDM69450.1 4-diphosphocytidyl-2-C-methyl-D-erythritolkinase [Clostridium bornimense]
MIVKCYGKINLSLDVVGKREDGYHLLEMVMQTVDLYDTITLTKLSSGIEICCSKPYVPNNEKNIAYKAAELFINTYSIKGGVKINIEKNIPVSAGMAGGSSNAAGVLRGLRDLYKVPVSDKDLEKLSLLLGADVPYCIKGGTVLCSGIGEKMTPLKPFNNVPIVIVKPNFGVSTIYVYKNFNLAKVNTHVNTYDLIRAMDNMDLNGVKNNMRNLLENVTLGRHKILKSIKNDMINNGAIASMMSGSGPTIFGICEDSLSAQKLYDFFKDKFNDVYITRTIEPTHN